MAETIPGGAYQDAQARWIDSEGRPLSKALASEAQQLAAQREQERAEQERQARLLDAQRDPTARAIAAALAPAPQAAAPESKSK